MPVHDWNQVDDGIFHSFHVGWIGELSKALNRGILPKDYYALSEQIAGGVGPDVLTLKKPLQGSSGPSAEDGGLAVAQTPPRVQRVFRAEVGSYTLKQKSIVIRHSSNHRMVAIVEILSPGNKSSRHAIRTLLDKSLSILAYGIHLLLVDLFPPGPRDPKGVHFLIWEHLTGEEEAESQAKPLSLVSYDAGPEKTAYVQPVAVGDRLPDMPLFFLPGEYVNVPMESTYQEAFSGVPGYYQDILGS